MSAPELTSVALGLASAVSWGAGDFSGGLATRRTGVYGVMIASQVVGAGLLTVSALALGERLPPAGDLLWGGVAGLAGAAGLIALYRALASGRMGVAAPVSAVVGAAVPVVVGAFVEGWPGAPRLAGFGLALGALWLISRPEGAALEARDLGLPLMAGAAFGLFFIVINRVSHTAALWPLVAARLASLGAMLSFTTLTRRAWLPAPGRLPLIALAGVLDACGNALYALAGRFGRLDVVAVLASLYPASTIWLAWLVLKERFSRRQMAGIVAALGAIALIAA